MPIEGYQPPPELLAILPGTPQRVGHTNDRYWPGIAALLDLLVALGGSVSATAAALGVSTGATSRLLLEDPNVGAAVNEMRTQRGLKPLRGRQPSRG